MSANAPDPVILDYIRANRGAFSREAIDRELRLSGHQPEAIVAAWAAIEAEDAPVPSPTAPQEPTADQLSPEYEHTTPEAAVTQATPAPVAARDPAIERYIRENRGTYTRPAITDSLLASGHGRADIEATWDEIAAAEAPPPSPEAQAGRRAILGSWRFWVVAVATAITLIALPIALTIAAPDQPAIGTGTSCVLMLGFVAAGLILLGVGKARDVAFGLLAGVGALFALSIILSVIGFILLFIVIGICLVVIGTGGGP